MRDWIFGIIIFFFILLFIFFKDVKINKEEVAKYYNITKPTLNKWVKYFPCSMTPEQWKVRRKLTLLESELIKSHWGNEPDLALNKNQIADKGSACYKSLTKCVMENLEKIGLTEEAWKKCSVFPPVICQRIIDLLLGKPEPTLQERLALAVNNN